MDNEKLFEFMEKIYSEMQQGFKKVDKRFDKVEERFEKVEKTVTTIGQEHGKKLEALLDGYNQTYEKLTELEKKVNEISEKVDKHDIKIQVIEGGKKGL